MSIVKSSCSDSPTSKYAHIRLWNSRFELPFKQQEFTMLVHTVLSGRRELWNKGKLICQTGTAQTQRYLGGSGSP